MSTFRHLVAAPSVAGMLSACGSAADLTGPNTIAAELRGTWAEPQGIPGVRFEFTLSTADTAIAGTRVFAIEAGASGTMTVSGLVDGADIHLDFLDSIERREHFVGRLIKPDSMSRAFWQEVAGRGSDPVTISFKRPISLVTG